MARTSTGFAGVGRMTTKQTEKCTAWLPGQLCRAKSYIAAYVDNDGVRYARYIIPGETFLLLDISKYNITEPVTWKVTLLLKDGLVVWCSSEQLFTTELVTQC